MREHQPDGADRLLLAARAAGKRGTRRAALATTVRPRLAGGQRRPRCPAAVRVSADLERHVGWLQQDTELGFERVYLHNACRPRSPGRCDSSTSLFASRITCPPRDRPFAVSGRLPRLQRPLDTSQVSKVRWECGGEGSREAGAVPVRQVIRTMYELQPEEAAARSAPACAVTASGRTARKSACRRPARH